MPAGDDYVNFDDYDGAQAVPPAAKAGWGHQTRMKASTYPRFPFPARHWRLNAN